MVKIRTRVSRVFFPAIIVYRLDTSDSTNDDRFVKPKKRYQTTTTLKLFCSWPITARALAALAENKTRDKSDARV